MCVIKYYNNITSLAQEWNYNAEMKDIPAKGMKNSRGNREAHPRSERKTKIHLEDWSRGKAMILQAVDPYSGLGSKSQTWTSKSRVVSKQPKQVIKVPVGVQG